MPSCCRRSAPKTLKVDVCSALQRDTPAQLDKLSEWTLTVFFENTGYSMNQEIPRCVSPLSEAALLAKSCLSAIQKKETQELAKLAACQQPLSELAKKLKVVL